MGRVDGRFRVAHGVAVAACAAVLAGCASPGEPTERKPPVPQAVTDLSAEQSGNDAVLTFTLPEEATDGRSLDETPSIEVFRTLQSQGTTELVPGAATKPALLLTIPSGMVDRYAKAGHVRVAEALEAADFASGPSATAVYVVRTRVSAKQDSADSNAVTLRIHPAAVPIDDLKAEVVPSAVVLTWTPPEKTIAGPAASVGPYQIYRAEIAPPPSSATNATSTKMPEAPAAGGGSTKSQPALVKIGETDAPPFSDTQAIFGATYQYSVRSIVPYADQPIESADSNLVVVTPTDKFPPEAPQGLVVVLVPVQGTTPAHLELSWAISPETDIAGYNVYRSEQDSVQGTKQNTALLIAPAFRDMNVQPGRRYFYSVTAVDRSANESPVSEVVSGGVPAEGQAAP